MKQVQLPFGGLLGFGFLFLFSFWSCQTETEEPEFGDGSSYFPVIKGKAWVYASDSIVWSNNGSVIDTFKSFIREEVGEEFVGEDGKRWTEWLRFFSRDSLAWVPLHHWKTWQGTNQLIRVEENIPLIKLVYPFRLGLRWDGNALFDADRSIQVAGERLQPYQNWRYKIDSVSLSFPCVDGVCEGIRVEHIDASSILDRRKSVEYFVDGIGLVRKEMIILDGDGSRPNDSWEKKAKKGFMHTLVLLSYN